MENIIVITIIKSIGVYALTLFLTRLIGRKLISQMTFFDFVIGVSMGSLVANSIVGKQPVSISAMTALILLSILTIFTGYIQIKSFKASKVVNSEPVIVIENGNIVEKNMRNLRLTITELTMKLRQKNAFNIADIEFAIMETDGNFSVLLKSDKQPLTPKDMKIQTASAGLTKDIIIDGYVMEENLKDAKLDMKWLKSQLNSQDIKDVSAVFYAGLDSSKKLYVSKKSINNSEPHGKYGIE